MGIEASNVGQQSEKGFWREATLQVLTTIFRKQAANAELRKQLFEANVNAARDENHMQVACVCASAGSCVRVPAICMRRSRTRVCAHTRAGGARPWAMRGGSNAQARLRRLRREWATMCAVL